MLVELVGTEDEVRVHYVATALLTLAVVAYEGAILAQTVPQTNGQSPEAEAWRFHSSVQEVATENHDLQLSRPVLESSVEPLPLFDIQDSDVKFKLQTLMDILRDSRHESWVLAAYPDPKTGRPLIGAGFNLAVGERLHFQSDPNNPNQFIEPSTGELWQAAGLDLRQLQHILEQYDLHLKAWNKKLFRMKIRNHELLPDINEEEASRLLLISVIEAIHNARAYCNHFDQLNASQQMGLTQLVYQMGVNLEEFTQFLATINDQTYDYDSIQVGKRIGGQDQHWKDVQRTLIQSDWARRYTNRALTVIAMFDLNYDNNIREAERRVAMQIRPLVLHRRRRTPTTRVAHHSVPGPGKRAKCASQRGSTKDTRGRCG